ncbi:protein DEHYDRATION-INDUCED 19-like protein 2-like isoform X1 [Iris pallida]|uniref:Protein DEHYDRATION-INDUCED 19-like protein 2-like isoform X1 n=1 Tax=Iris pallida TaxID=29817 RepID=A0AAX6DIM0_IRIPA|nr:protein DEHYDRATION-INDUCED 19-like protein 2-like isoform X1 [Iris pallida]
MFPNHPSANQRGLVPPSFLSSLPLSSSSSFPIPHSSPPTSSSFSRVSIRVFSTNPFPNPHGVRFVDAILQAPPVRPPIEIRSVLGLRGRRWRRRRAAGGGVPLPLLRGRLRHRRSLLPHRRGAPGGGQERGMSCLCCKGWDGHGCTYNHAAWQFLQDILFSIFEGDSAEVHPGPIQHFLC